MNLIMATPGPQPSPRNIRQGDRSSIYITKDRFDEKLEHDLFPSDLGKKIMVVLFTFRRMDCRLVGQAKYIWNVD